MTKMLQIQIFHEGDIMYLEAEDAYRFQLFSFTNVVHERTQGNRAFGSLNGTRPMFGEPSQVVQAADPTAEHSPANVPTCDAPDKQPEITRPETATDPSVEEKTTTPSQSEADEGHPTPATPRKRRGEEAQSTPRVGNDRCGLCITQGRDACDHERAQETHATRRSKRSRRPRTHS